MQLKREKGYIYKYSLTGQNSPKSTDLIERLLSNNFFGWICLGDNLIYAFSDICKNMFCEHDGQRLMCL